MADGQYNIKIVVSDGGGTKLAEKDLANLGSAVSRVGKSHRDAAGEAHNFYDTQAKGVIGTANSTKSFSKLAETIGGGSSGLVGAYATLAANLFAVTAAFNALRGASQVEQIFRGLEASGNRVGRTLSVAAQGLVDVTNNAISMEQALRSTAQISSAGFGADTIKALGQAARDTSFALGRNMTDSLDRLTRGVVKLEPELLDELGIMTKLNESNSMYANKLGKSETALTNFEKRQGFLNAVLAEAQLKFGGLSEAAGDSTNYDKLSATLANLGNTVLNVINQVAKPIAGILAGSMTTLAGVGILFASTLKNQLAPGLLNSAAAAQRMAEKLKVAAEAQLENVTAAKELAKAQAVQEVNARANYDFLGSKGPKVYRDIAASVKDGTASVKEQNAAVTSLQRSIRANEALMQNNAAYAPGTAGGAQKAQDIANLRAELDAVKALQTARSNAANLDVEANQAVIAAEREAAAAAQLAQTQRTSASALEAAANFKVSDSVKLITQATKEYHEGLLQNIAAVEATGKISVLNFTKVRTAMFAAGLAARAFGVALLNAIPIIGQIVFAVGLLKEVWDASKSDAQKAQEKAMSDLGTVTASVNDKLAALNKTNHASASEALRTQQALTIQSNAVNEIVDSYKALRAAQNEVINGQNQKTGQATLLEQIFGSKQDIASYWLGVDRSSAALKIFNRQVQEGAGSINGGGISDEVKGTITSLGALEKIAPSVTKKVIDLHGGFDRLSKLSEPQQLSEVYKILTDIQNRVGPLAQNLDDLTGSLKALNISVGDFLVGAAQTTKYDTIVQNFNSVTGAMATLFNASSKGQGAGVEEWSRVLTGIGPNLMKFLSPATQEFLKQREAISGMVQGLQQLADSGVKLDASQRFRLENGRQELADMDKKNRIVADDLEKASDMFALAQHNERVLKSQVVLAQAQLNANQANYDATAAGVGARIDQENKIKSLQAAQLESQRAIIEASIAEAKVQLSKLQTLDLQNAAVKDLTTSQIRLNLETAKGNQDYYKKFFAQQYGNTPEALRAIGNTNRKRLYGNRADALNNNINTYFQNDQRISDLSSGLDRKVQERSLTQSIQAQVDSAKALSDEIDAIYKSQISAEQKLAQMATKNAEVQAHRLELLTAQRGRIEDMNDAYRAADRLLNGTTDTLREQLSIITTSAARQKSTAQDAANANLLTLRARLQEAQADANKASTPAEKQASAERIKYATEELSLAEQGLSIDLQSIDAQSRLAILEKVVFDTRKEGLEWQQTSFDYIQRQLDATRSLSDALQTQYELQQKLIVKRKGVGLSDQGQEAIDIRAAAEAYKLAVQEVTLKKGLIDLEFALLDAQKQQLEDDLRARRANLDASDPRNTTRIAQINSILDRLSTVDLQKTAELSKKTLDVQVENAKLTLQTAITRTLKELPFNDVISTVTGIVERRRQRAAAANILSTTTPSAGTPVIAGQSVGERDRLATAETANSPLIRSNTSLMDKIDEWIHVIQEVMKVQLTSGNEPGTTTAGGRPGQALSFFMSKGYSRVQAAALVGNLQQESSMDLDPTKKNPSSGAYGIAQWLSPGRIAKFAEEFGHSIYNSTFKEQLEFIEKELNSTEGNAKKLLLATNNLAEATYVVRKFYERPGEAEANDRRRLGNATALYNTTAPSASTPASAATASNVKSTPAAAAKATAQAFSPVADVISEIDKNAVTTLPNVQALLDTIPVLQTAKGGFDKIYEALDLYDTLTAKTIENLKALGPEGEVVAALSTGMSTIVAATTNTFKVFDSSTSTSTDKFVAMAQVASAALTTIQSAVASSAQAKEAAIDREIAAEQKRDGKSVQSQAKLAALEKRKDEIARKAFNTNKKLMMAQAIVATATGVAMALSSSPPPFNIILAGVVGALGAAQLAIIAGTSYQSTTAPSTQASTPSQLTIGKIGDTVDLAKQNTNVGGELGYLRGKQGYGANSSNYSVVGSAYGGQLGRGYGNNAYIVGEKGPERISMDTPITVSPANDNSGGSSVAATINIHAVDAAGVENVLQQQKGNIISMLREAANSNGQTFMEDVNVNVYSRPNTANRL